VFGLTLSSPVGLVAAGVGALLLGAVPLTTGIAILRYRLYDIDLIINRTLVYGVVTISLGAAFLLITNVSQSVLQAATGSNRDLISIIIGLSVALGYQPLRRWVQVAVDSVLPAREERALLFTDIVGSTELLAEAGDAAWRLRLDQYRAAVRRELKRFGGTEMHIAGDSFFATFTDPIPSVRCAQELAPRLDSLALPSRFGLHWGVCEMRGPEVSGMAVWIAARVMSVAGSGEIVVSDALREAVGESGLEMRDRGRYSLKGLAGEWPTFTVSVESNARSI
jgi:class 3 adenylate cyclase